MPTIRQVRGVVHKSDGTAGYTDWFTDDGRERALEETLKLVENETEEYHVSWERREIEAAAKAASPHRAGPLS